MVAQLYQLLGGALFFFIASSLFRPGSLRRLAIACGSGCALGYGLTALNNMRKHSFTALNEPIRLNAPSADFRTMYEHIFEHISDHYDELGQLEVGEEHLTVMQNVFAQIGTLDVDGIRKMWTSVVIPQLRSSMNGESLSNYIENSSLKLEENTVFCDIGSGVGNVCLQILAETRCKKVVGVEVIPSRCRSAVLALANAKNYYPEHFAGKDAVFLNDDLVNCVSRLTEERVNVIFAHSWMFDDDLMLKLTELVTSVPTVLCVVTSRRLAETALQSSPLKLVSQVHLTADWNEQAPFYVYSKNPAK
ncbi:histone-lysine N-methyltransferase [Trypanosoma conorhini]|uniref:Histone-lysine N-methyltransferase, H3 lysine-79 specific n=1 Tax=Trypanosoma conorhini TaxID=83891 RepID=A0A422MS39_9TRYP|nr:histone-lysine N-methyltransferase [Trypanosoma conorhini]RNE95991.1 histone-lysine N-methyltransferase [Trypanosoma conorhini]